MNALDGALVSVESSRVEARLIAFPPSVDTETARWVLSHHRVAFREERQSAIGTALTTLCRRAAIPVLLTGGAKLSPSRPIADHLDGAAAPEQRLVPAEAAQAAEVGRLWRQWNGGLGVWIAQWVYYYVLQDQRLALRLITDGVPGWQAALDRMFRPAVLWGLRKGLGGLDRHVAQAALASCQKAFDAVEARLADGRSYQVGDRLTLADVAFCACAAPLMLADVYGGALPRLDEVPEEMRREVERFRARPAGHYVMRLYAAHYHPLCLRAR